MSYTEEDYCFLLSMSWLRNFTEAVSEGDVGKLSKLHRRVVNKDLLMDEETLNTYLEYKKDEDLNYPLRKEPKLIYK